MIGLFIVGIFALVAWNAWMMFHGPCSYFENYPVLSVPVRCLKQ